MRVLRWAGRVWAGVLLAVVLAFGVLLALRIVLPLLPLSARPALATTVPAPGATAVAPRSQLTLQFSTAMNPRSVERALRLEPAAPLDLAWSADGTALTISPGQPLAANTRYTLRLGEGAYSRWFRPIEAPAVLEFQVAPAPAVQAAFPQPGAGNVALDAAISLSFSRPIVAADQVGTALAEPLLRFEPPVEGETVWLDPATALFQPAAPLQAGTRYTATVEAGLVDAGGGELARPYAWSFSTPAPRLLAITPAAGMERVSPRSPIVFTFSQPMRIETLRAALTISPTVAGEFASAELPDATHVMTFTPTQAFAPNTVYAIRLAPGALPKNGNMPLAGFQSSFRSAPQPTLSGRFPGEGQLLPEGQALRLIFTTPLDGAALRNGLRFEPPVEIDQIAIRGNEARIEARFSAATVYTATIAPAVADANGVALGRPYQLRFQTAPAAPALLLTDAASYVVQLPLGEVGPRFRRTNLAQFQAALYALDEDSTVRLLAFGERDWRDFSPERAGLTPLRQWTPAFTDTLNTTVDDRLALLDGGQTPATGSYYLRLRSPEGLAQDAVLFVGNTRLAVQRSSTELVVWATGAGSPLDAAPLSLFRGGALIERGQSGPDGIWRTATATSREPLLVLANGTFALAEAETAAQWHAALLADRAAYAPGETAQIAGFVRATNGAPLGDVRGTLALLRRATAERVAAVPVEVAANGVISTSLELARNLVPGDYTLSLGLGSQLFTREIAIVAASPAPALTVAMPQALVSGAPLAATLTATTGQNLPLASGAISWTARYEPLDSLGDDFTVGEASPIPSETSGSGRLDRNGMFAATISATLEVTAPLRITVEAQTTNASGATVRATASTSVLPASESVGVRLPGRIVQAGEAFDAELFVRDLNAAPVANRVVLVEVYRAAAGQLPLDAAALRRARVFSRTVRTGADGRVPATVRVNAGGEYRLVASVTGETGQTARTVLPLWATADNFAGWPQLAPGQPLPVVADRLRYAPGETARLLVPAAIQPGTALVTTRRGERLETTVQPIRAGGVITVPVGAESPLLPVEIQLGGAPQATTMVLPVTTESALRVGLGSDAAAYMPGATATFTITTADANGQPVSADVVFGISNENGATLAWHPGLRTSETGLLTITARLTDTAQTLLARATAADGSAQLASAQQTIAVTQPLALALNMPPNLHAGDTFPLRARVRNTSGRPLQPRLTLAPQGLDITGGDLARSVALAPGQETTLEWQVRVQPTTLVRARLKGQTGSTQEISAEQRILPTGAPTGTGALLRREYLDPDTGQPVDLARLRVGQLVEVRLTLVTGQALNGATVEDALPGGMLLSEAQPQQLRFGPTRFEPGVYQFRYTLQAAADGMFRAPAPVVRLNDGAVAGAGEVVEVTIRR